MGPLSSFGDLGVTHLGHGLVVWAQQSIASVQDQQDSSGTEVVWCRGWSSRLVDTREPRRDFYLLIDNVGCLFIGSCHLRKWLPWCSVGVGAYV